MILAEPTAGPVTFTYNAEGRRIEKQTPTEAQRFIYDFKRLLQETDDAGAVEHQYTFTNKEYGDLVSEYDALETAYHQHDALGTTDALLDDNETATDRYQHRAFGVQESHTGTSDTPFTFIGQKNYYRDSELDIYLAGARYYDPLAGRWLSEDPKRYEAGDSNLYRYVSNNPVNNIDPTGKEGWASIEDLRVFAPTAKEIKQYQQRTHQKLAEHDRTVGLERDLPPRTPERVEDVAYPYRQKLFQHYRQQGVNGEVVYNSDGDAVGAIFSRRSDYLTREQAGDNTYSTWEHDKDYHRFDLYSFDDNGFNGSFLGSAVVGPMQYVRQEYRQQRIAPSHEPAMIPGVSNVGAIVANAQRAIRTRQAVGMQYIATLPVSSMKTAESNGSFVSNAESSGYHEDVSGYLDRMNAQEDVLRTGMSSRFAHQQDRGQVILTGRHADVLHFAADTGEAAIVVAEFAPGGGIGVWLGKAASGDEEHEATLANLGWAVLADLVAAEAVKLVAKWIRGRLIVKGADGRTVEFTKEAIEEARARLKNSGLAGTDEEVERYVRLSLEHGEDAGDLAKAGNRVAEGIAPIRTITDAVRHRAGNRQILAGNQRWHLPKDTPTSHIPIADPVGDQLQSAASQAAQRWNRTFLSPNEAAAIRQAHVDGKHWLGNLLERQARGRWVEGQVQQQFPQLNWSRTGADVVDPATGITYDILSATRHNMDLHAQRMADVLFRMITF